MSRRTESADSTCAGAAGWRQRLELEFRVKVFHGLAAIDPPLTRSVLTIGNFDGVHRAHQQLLAQAGLFASNTGGPVVVLTFEPHPLSVVSPGKAPARLTWPDEKLRYLQEAGVDIAVIAESEPTLLGLDAEEFITRIIWESFRPTHVVEGPSFGFGRGRKGTPELLTKVADRLGFEVHIVEPVTLQVNGEKLLVSSSLVRRLLCEGKVRKASLCLSRPYSLTGKVVRGDARGRTLGFPTANLDDTGQLVPADAVYAGRAILDDNTHRCAISVGHAPTFDGSKQRVEAHLLDFDRDIYGRTIRVEFHRFLRPQTKFDTPVALKECLQRDVRMVHDGTPGLPTRTLQKQPTPT